jgi:uncharacterized membrane protein YoaK (UPF0700 family)
MRGFAGTDIRAVPLAALLSFNGGFVDTAGFLGLDGLFVAHVTGNLVTLGAALVFGTHAVVNKLAALPEFVTVIVLAHLAGGELAARGWPALRILLGAKLALLLAFFGLAVGLGPFPDSDTPAALLTGFAGVAAMAVQNAIQRARLASAPPTNIMTGNTTQVALDMADLLRGVDPAEAATIRGRLGRTVRTILGFTVGSAAGALSYAFVGFWCLAVPVVVGAAAVAVRLKA